MIELIETLNYILALGGLALLLGTAILIYDFKTTKSLAPILSKYGLLLAFLLALGSAVMTLVYSEIFGFIPCGLCWMQRVFLYPQVLLLGTAIYLKDKTVFLYGIVLSIPGLLISLYQHYLQMGGSELVTCPTAGAGADCAERILFEFGFMTFPLLSAATFLFLMVLYWYLRKV